MEEKANVEEQPEAEHPVAKALREELTSLLKGPLTVKLLNRINRLTEAGCSTLEALDAAGPRRRRRMGMGIYNAVGGYETEDGGVEPSYEGIATNGETYGATVARELVSAATQFMHSQTARTNEPDPVKMVQAIAAAREAGLADVEQGLRDKLGVRAALAAVLPKDLGPARCPSCDSTSPQRHPAMQSEGEVRLCANPFHWPYPPGAPAAVAGALP